MMFVNKEKNFISAVVYVYNQEKTIETFLEQITYSLGGAFENYEIICVDDGSSDCSTEVIKRYAKSHTKCMISILHMSFYQGLELSMNAGLDLAIGDFIYEFDAPFEDHSGSLILDIYFHALKGYDIVSAVPKEQNHKISTFFYFVFNRVSGTQYMLRTELFRILSRRAINRVKSMSKVITYRKAVYANCGLSMDTLFGDIKSTHSHNDRKTRRNQRETALDALIMYTDLAYRCSMIVSLLMMFSMIASGVYAMLIYWSGKPVAGWTTTMLFLAGGFLGLFIILTVLIKYSSIILKLNFNRQKYIVESIEKLK